MIDLYTRVTEHLAMPVAPSELLAACPPVVVELHRKMEKGEKTLLADVVLLLAGQIKANKMLTPSKVLQ